MKFAKDTEVSTAKSRAEIEATVMRYKASEFMSGWKADQAQIGFKMQNRTLKFVLPLPYRQDFRFTDYRRQRRSDAAMEEAYEQACRQKWRALLLVIKAKLEAVEGGIATFDEEFLSHIVMPNGLTIGEQLAGEVPQLISGGLLLPTAEQSEAK
jgi:hypothetical protein